MYSIILAPATSGKTQACIDRIRQAIEAGHFGQVWVIVPDRWQRRAFQWRLARAGCGVGVRIGTFGFLYREILAQAGAFHPFVSAALAQRLIGNLVHDQISPDDLGPYAPLADKPGFIQVLRERIGELKRASIWPETLAQQPGYEHLARIYQAYQNTLHRLNWADQEGISWLAVEALQNDSTLPRNLHLLVLDGFDAFNPTQRQVIRLLADRVPELVITLPGTPDMSRRAYTRFRRVFEALCRDLPTAAVETLESPRQPSALSFLEANLFESNGVVWCGKSPPVYLRELRSPAEEAREALRWLKAKLLRDHASLPQCAIFVPDFDLYRFGLESAARSFGLPLQFSQPPVLLDHPAIASLLTALSLPGYDFPRRETLDTLRSPFFDWSPLRPDDTWALEKVSQHGQVLGGREIWLETLQALSASAPQSALSAEEEGFQPPRLPRGEEARSLAASLTAWMDRLTPAQPLTLEAWVNWLEDLLEASEFERRCPEEVLAALRDGLRALLLGEILPATGKANRPISQEVFLAQLRSTLANLEIKPDLTAQNGIFVGRFIEARGLRFRFVAVLGLSEGLFPAVEKADPFLPDDLRQKLGMEPRTERHQEGLFYQVVTRADEALLVTRPYLGESGEAWMASPYWNALLELFPNAGERISPEAPRALSHAASPQEALVWAARQKYSPQKDAELIARMARVQAGAAILKQRLASVQDSPHNGDLTALEKDFAARFDSSFIWSASSLETYAQCPYRFFAERVLNLEQQEKPELGIDARQLGTLYHQILAETFGHGVAPDDPDAVEAALRKVAEKHLTAAPQELGFRPGPAWEAEKVNLLAILAETCRALAAESVGWKTVAQEKRFGFDDQPPLQLSTTAGEVQMRGIVDRIDKNGTALRVIDYKTGSTGLSKSDLERGERLQLPLYALAARDALGVGEPSEAWYWQIHQAKKSGLKLSATPGRYEIAFDDAWKIAREHVGRIVSGVREGRFQPHPPNSGCPPYCPASAWCWQFSPKSY